METKNLTLQESILISVVILVVALLGVQYSKQKSIERQQVVKMQAEQKEKAEAKKERDWQETLLNMCLSTANEDYWAYMKLNGTENDDGTVWASDYYWKTGKADKKVAEDACYKKYR